MTDSTAPAGKNGGSAPIQAVQTAIVPLAQYVRDLSFESPNAPKILSEMKRPPEVQVGVDVSARGVGPDVYEVMLNVKAEAKLEGQTAFLIELAYAGLFAVRGAPPDQIGPLLVQEGPRFLFPFARAIIADATRDGGFPPLMLQPIDFTELAQRSAAQAGQSADPAAQQE
jgi:preprotein translocase subunit SecB